MSAQHHVNHQGIMSRLLGGRLLLLVTVLIGVCAGVLWRINVGVASWLLILTAAASVLHSLWGLISDIRKGHVGVDILAIVALMSTIAVHEYWAGWVVVLMVFSGEAIEDFAESKAQRNLETLVQAAPSVAHVGGRSSDGETSWNTVPVDQVNIGDTLLVKPGETIPVNGFLKSEQATLDLSMINGAPLPVDIYSGSKLSSGAINGASAITMTAAAKSADSQYQKIIELVKSAQESRSASVKTADLLAVPFTVISLAIAFMAWGISQDPMRFAEVLVIATPCPLLIAAPVAFMGGTGRLAKAGIVIKAQDILERLGGVTHVFFDKTGTLTRKKPRVDRIELSQWSREQGIDADRLLVDAGLLEGYSSHILARGVENAALSLIHDKALDRPAVADARESTGNGVEGRVSGRLVKVGRLHYVDSGITDEQIASQYPALASNEMVTYVSSDGHMAGRIILKDFPRENAADTIQWLRRLGTSHVTMLTGDKADSAAIVSTAVGIDDVRSELLPEEKVYAVEQAREEHSFEPTAFGRVMLWMKGLIGLAPTHGTSMMVGDGVNDAPVLAASDIGVAMTDGSSTAASESAQVVIMNDDIAMVPTSIVISRQTKRIMLQAVYGGLIAAILCMIVAAFGLIPAVVGALIQEIIDVLCILWALTAIIDRKIRR
ncbi:MAG: heavy metal translocating P-type ATPase [Bifidobacterium psychraerophilum]|uniref:heavy metal translocating P-type ATPase n=1 Tax=Bifidobacterium psychraerophilum TaxID=218140 RepID=UPI0039EB6F27